MYRHPYKTKNDYLLDKYGITEEEYGWMMEWQEGRCVVKACRKVLKKGVGMDSACLGHCHKTLEVRQILCSRCNLALGRFNDDMDKLEEYVKIVNSRPVVIKPVLPKPVLEDTEPITEPIEPRPVMRFITFTFPLPRRRHNSLPVKPHTVTIECPETVKCTAVIAEHIICEPALTEPLQVIPIAPEKPKAPTQAELRQKLYNDILFYMEREGMSLDQIAENVGKSRATVLKIIRGPIEDIKNRR